MNKTQGLQTKIKYIILAAALLFYEVLFLNSYAHAQNKLPTVMSLDYCSDQYVLSLADREQIIALSEAAEDLYSYHRERAKGIAKSGSTIAEVVMAKPDIAIQTYTAAARMGEITQRVGVKLLNTSYGRDVDTMFENMTIIAKTIGQQEKADKLISDYRKRLVNINNSAKSNLKVAYLTPGGFTAGAGTFVDDIIRLSGFETYASAHKYQGWLPLPLEDMIMDPPDVIITSFFDSNMTTQSRWSLGRHDHLLKMMNETPTIHLPGALMACDGLFLIEAAEQIRLRAKELGILQ